jgi:putative transposase
VGNRGVLVPGDDLGHANTYTNRWSGPNGNPNTHFHSHRFRAACRDYRLRQEFITPYTPEQNGLIERFFQTPKEECVWQHNFASFTDARREALSWIDWYNSRRPHSALGYRSPAEFRAQQLNRVA